jgi:hypothetical protein
MHLPVPCNQSSLSTGSSPTLMYGRTKVQPIQAQSCPPTPLHTHICLAILAGRILVCMHAYTRTPAAADTHACMLHMYARYLYRPVSLL